MPADLLLVGRWLLQVFQELWAAFGTWGFLGFAIIFFPILRKMVRLFRSLVHTLF